MDKRFAFTIFILLAIPLAFAQTVNKENSHVMISPLGEAAFNISVTNDNSAEDTLQTQYTPDYTTGMDIPAHSSRDSRIYIKPGNSIGTGTYFVELRIISQLTKQSTSRFFTITVDPKYVDYSVTIPAEILEPTSIDPAQSNSVKVRITNPYPVYFENLSVDAQSKFLTKEAVIDLPPKSEKIVDFSLNIDASTPKQDDNLKITVSQKNKVIATAEKTLSIKEFKLPYKTAVETTKGFLQTVMKITFTNTEGAQKTQDASIEKPNTLAVIYTTPLATTIDFDGKEYLSWSGVSLRPDETYSVTVVEDFRTLAGIAVLIIAGIMFYYSWRSPIIVRKKAYGVHKKDTGNNEIKIVLYLKNRSGRYIEKVRVLERLPFIHKVEPDFGPGTPEPKFRRSHEGIVLDWDIGLAPHEERVFTYRMKSSLPIVGEYTLRPCVVQYGKKGRRVSSDSYRLSID